MDAQDLERSAGTDGVRRMMRAVRTLWRPRPDGAGDAGRGERARVPGPVHGADPEPGGGTVRFARSSLRVRVTVGGAVFCGWDGAEPEPSDALGAGCPEADQRAVLEPDKEGGWRVVSERVTVAVSRYGTTEVRTPGGVVLRRDLPPRWWEPVNGAGHAPRWMQRSEVPADTRFFGPAGPATGARLRDGLYRLGGTSTGGGAVADGCRLSVSMPVVLAVADAGTHLRFHDTPSEGRLHVREGTEGAGSGHDRPGTCELRVAGGPHRSWTVVGSPARVLHAWSSLTGPPVVPPSWALGHQHVVRGSGKDVQRAVNRLRERGLAPSSVHFLEPACRAGASGAVAGGGADRPRLARELHAEGVRLVSVHGPGAGAQYAETPCTESEAGRDRREVPIRAADRPAPRGESPGPRETPAQQRVPSSDGGPFRLSRPVRAGMQRSGGTWSEGKSSGWPALREALAAVLGLGLCGVPYSGPHPDGNTGARPNELALRSLQLRALLPLLLTDGTALGELLDRGPADELLAGARAALAQRDRLLPYFATLAQVTRRTGAPWVRPLWWKSPHDRALRDCDDAFLLGDAFLVAPVLEPGVRSREIRLPRGRWYDTATAEVHEGPGRIRSAAPLSRIPVLARAGAVVPVTGPGGSAELEVWPPAPGRRGGGLAVTAASGAGGAVVERFTTQLIDGRVEVRREGGAPAGRTVRIRGRSV
ncbi:glycoside hydrolase family 31 protein [Streptomyces meridianus]|uniref:Glycoside hydrolase family 31 protein n=1 Tax=Streptomyces meridianus TaxID=2938945 RepID=A0ABT0XBT2_9ACTN|nr:glycoside hydrolase family 31 protein [Streptomyces meridianus]MCM2579259.1 glycoside hydrolase family 31 protein [Streptomyces meridianus]